MKLIELETLHLEVLMMEMKNSYHYLYTYNFLNEGSQSNGTQIGSGFRIATEHGVPGSDIYWDPSFDIPGSDKYKYWMTGFDNYISGLNNGLVEYYKIEFNENYSSLNDLKHWLNDHHEGGDETIGGVAEIVAYSGDGNNLWTISFLPNSSPYSGEKVITQWETFGPHSMTIVGYDDDIKFDFNGDGEYTTNINLDGDPTINLHDREIGAFLVANSWGAYPWGNEGFIWVPYKLMVEGLASNGYVYVCEVEEYTPDIVIKAEIEHNHRKKIRIAPGRGNKANDSEPDEYPSFYRAFNAQGGSFDMRGIYNGPIDISLDYGMRYSEDIGKVFLCIKEGTDINNDYYGDIHKFSLIDYRWDEEFELELEIDENNPIPINDGALLGAWTYIGIEYDLLSTPDDIWPLPTQIISSNKVCRFETLLANNSTLTIKPIFNEHVKLDLYDAVLTIPEGATLDLGNYVILTGKKGVSRIDVYGSLELGNEAEFKADEGAELILNFPNENKSYVITGTTFSGAELRTSCSDIEIDNCEFKKYGHIEINAGDTKVHNCTFTDGYIRVFSEEKLENTVLIYNNTFDNTTLSKTSISIDNYTDFYIYQNEISYYYGTGIGIYNSGSSDGIHTFDIVGNEVSCNNNKKANIKKTGIKIYNSNANILESNYIHNNEYGISCLNYSTTKITGLPSTYCSYLPQKIINNTVYQVYLSGATFPIDFHKNQIFDNGFTTTFIYELPTPTIPIKCNVVDNYWGGLTDPSSYLVTNMTPDWDPICTPFKSSPSASKFDSAVNMVVSEDYQIAEEIFKEIISDTLEANYRYASLNQLFELEGIYNQDYIHLKQYLDTNIIFQDSTSLSKMSNHISNKCDIKLENYQSAINYYEDIINNSGSCEDSTFAIIDLGYLYLSMNANRSNMIYSCQFPQFIPLSIPKFEADRNKLIDLLYGEKLSSVNYDDFISNGISVIENVKIFPNPTAKVINIEFSNTSDLNLSFSILEQTGKLLFETETTDFYIGKNNTAINLAHLNSGVYLVSIKNRGRSIMTKKLIISR